MRGIISGLGAAGGALLLYSALKEKRKVAASWTVPHVPPEEFHPKWDYNWDRREPHSLVKPVKDKDGKPQQVPPEKSEASKASVVRHIILIRHGQYNMSGKSDSERTLTEIGQKQADLTGRRLAELALPYSTLIKSTMTRAIETAEAITKHLPKDIPRESCPLLHEGAPVPPEPPVGHWRPEQHFFEDGARIEAAFRKHFHRADPSQTHDSYDILVCHANVIRYFVCRALQFPPEAWLRFSLQHGSITWLSMQPSGRVTLRTLGDTGHMPPQLLTSS